LPTPLTLGMKRRHIHGLNVFYRCCHFVVLRSLFAQLRAETSNGDHATSPVLN